MDTFSFILVLNTVFFITLLISKSIVLSLVLAGICLFILVYLSQNKKISDAMSSLTLSARFSALKDKHYLYTIISLVLFMFLENIIGFNASIITGFFLFSYLNKLDSQAGFIIALSFLILTAFLSISHSLIAAQSTAILAYYFLVIGTVWLMIEVKKSNL